MAEARAELLTIMDEAVRRVVLAGYDYEDARWALAETIKILDDIAQEIERPRPRQVEPQP